MKISSNELSKSAIGSSVTTTSTTTLSTQSAIDINVLRERSKHLDLPLISALCNDRTLLKQTAIVIPKHQNSPIKQNTLQSSKAKYPISALTMLNTSSQPIKSRAKTSISHRHPNDKLPPLPMQTTITGNNYVMDPAMKHKSFSSQPNLKQA